MQKPLRKKWLLGAVGSVSDVACPSAPQI